MCVAALTGCSADTSSGALSQLKDVVPAPSGGFNPGGGPSGGFDTSSSAATDTATSEIDQADDPPPSGADTVSSPDVPAPLLDVPEADPDTVVVTDGASWDYALPPCGDQTIAVGAPVVPASVLLVVDRSESMKGSKWVDTKAAIAEITTTWGPAMRFALLMYPKEDNVCQVANTPNVPFALDNATAIISEMAAAELKTGTPTGGALIAASDIFANVPVDAPRVIILATDGQPNCPSDCSACTTGETGLCFGGSCGVCIKKQDCVKHELNTTVTALTTSGIPTYIIGLPGSEKAEDLLNNLAELGGTAIVGEAVKYYTAVDAASLATALGAIAPKVESCTAKIEPVAGYVFAIVEINGQKVLKDPTHQDGWDLVGGDTLQFFGPACAEASAGGASVSITYACKH